MKHPLIKIDEIPSEGTKIVDFFGRQLHIYQTNGRPRAVANTCMHFGGPLDFQDGKFVCQWHNAEFGCQHGERLSGPAPSNSKLMFISTRVEDDTLYYVWGDD